MSGTLDRIERFGMTYQRELSIAVTVWFWFNVAVYAGFIRLPEIPFLTDKLAVMLSTTVSCLWWAYLRPHIARIRKARLGEPPQNAELPNG